jgi:hypothetical protein
MATGGEVSQYADGGDTAPEALSPQAQTDVGSAMTSLPVSQPDPEVEKATQDSDRPSFVTPQEWAKMDPRVKLMQSDPVMAEQMFPSKGVLGMAEEKLKEMGQKSDVERQAKLEKLGLAQTPEQAQQAPMPASAAGQPSAVPPKPEEPASKLPGYEQGINQWYDQASRAIKEEEKAKVDQAKENESALAAHAVNQQQLTDRYVKQVDTLNTERKNFIQDIQNGFIDPEKYWTGDASGNGSHSRVMAGIGMILAGFNPTNSPNAAIDFVNKQIDRSVDAQKANLNAKHNLLAANLQQFKNVRDATDMTKIMQTDMVLNQLQIAAAKAANPLAKAAAMNASATLAKQASDLSLQMGMRRMMMGLASNPGGSTPAQIEQMISFANMTNPEMAKTMREAFVPGVGISKSMQPVPQGVREQIISHQKLNDAATDLLDFTKSHTTILPGTKDYNVGAQKSLVLQQMIREGLLGTVFRESEKPLLEKMVNENPANFFKEFNTNPKLRTLIEENQHNFNVLKQNYGLPAAAPAQPTSDMEGKTATGPNGQRVIMRGGKWIPHK